MKTKSRLAFILIPFFYYVILLGGSRTGMIVPIAGLFVMYALAKGIKQVHKIIIALAVIIILFLLYVNSNLPGADRISSLLNGFFNETSEVSFNERAMFRELAASMFVQKPIFGWGISSFTIYLLNINYRTHIFFYSSHNTYLEILACLGIVGFIIYYSMYLRILFRAFKNSVSKNVNIVFSLVVCFTLLMLEYGEVLFYTARGFTSATILFYAFYALKIYPEESKI
ncbi:MAG: O-antigen ligase family protein [Oscillospiraceae bacterium]|nr:O-antigen ligase family protein [Oscillospiraceae bacterium]